MKVLKYILLISGTGAFLIWGLYGFFLWDLGVRNDQIRTLDLENEQYKERFLEVKRMVDFLKKEEDRLAETEDLFLKRDNSEIVNFITEIEELGSETDVSLEIFGLSKEEHNGNIFLKANVEIFGDWQSVTQTVALIELIPYHIYLDNFHLKMEEEGWSSSLVLNVLTKE